MAFEGQYLTYAEYQALGGSAIGEMPFSLLEFEARKQIDLRTQKRLVDLSVIPQEVKLCVFHLIDRISSYNGSINSATNSDGSITSETTDGYSVGYSQVNATQVSEIVKSKNTEFGDIIMSDLYGLIINNEHVIYNGVEQ